jgi:hypothetical protein
MTNETKTILKAMLERAKADAAAAPVAAALTYALHAIDFVESCQCEDASTNADNGPDEVPSLPVYGNVDLPTLVGVGMWEAGKQIRFREEPPTW